MKVFSPVRGQATTCCGRLDDARSSASERRETQGTRQIAPLFNRRTENGGSVPSQSLLAKVWSSRMSAPLIAALFFTVALLVTTAYFLLGSVPLLVLKHDTPMDSRFVRGFYNTCYLATMFIASAAAVSYAHAGRLAPAMGGGAIALLAAGLRRKIIPRMESLGARIQDGETNAVLAFRRIHIAAILLNLAQLVCIVWSLIAASTAMMPPPVHAASARQPFPVTESFRRTETLGDHQP